MGRNLFFASAIGICVRLLLVRTNDTCNLAIVTPFAIGKIESSVVAIVPAVRLYPIFACVSSILSDVAAGGKTGKPQRNLTWPSTRTARAKTKKLTACLLLGGKQGRHVRA